VADAAGTRACLAAMSESGADLMGGRMLKPKSADGAAPEVDSLGISMYRSLLASNRKSTQDAYLGPTGGFAVLSRAFLERVKSLHGYVFDPSYFCYAEDTDLCVRARLMGERVGYCDQTVAYHAGQGSTTGTYSEFILYHGIRNSIWMAAKSMPGIVLLCHLPWVVVLHGGIVLRHTLQGRFKTLFLLYRDAICGLGRVLRERKAIQATRKVTAREFAAHIDRQFYETAFVGQALRDLFRRK
jgi:GT2 family glycosyltransferase